MTFAYLAAALLAAAFCAWPAFGQALRDPTEPPASVALPARAGAAAALPSGPVLQSVIVSDGRRLALIDGKTYQAGDKLGNATVAAISGNEVTLRGADGTKVLKLYPNLQKTIGGDPPPGSARARERP
jgi:MSHA biogenesis protein MshK